MLFVFQVPAKWTMFLSPLIVFFLFLFSLGISYILATAYVFFGDIKHLYTVSLTIWMYCSAIFYPVEQLQGMIRVIIWNNPIYTYIHCMRKAVMVGELPTRIEWIQILFWSVGIYLIGYLIFKKSRNRIMQKI